MDDASKEPQSGSALSRRRALQLTALTAGGVILGASAAAAAPAGSPSAGPGAAGGDGAGAAQRRSPAARSRANISGPTSYNGWPVGNPGSSIGVKSYYVTGTSILIPVEAGDVAWALMYVAARFNTEVEPLQGWQVWGYDYRVDANNTNWWSCHASGTAVDFNAVLHPNGASGTFTTGQVRAIRKILADCGDVIYWGGDFSGVPDEMHFEINVAPGDPQLPALVAQIRGQVPARKARVITMLAGVNAHFVTAEQRGYDPLIANRALAGYWEQFDVITVNATQIALRAHANNRFVCADQAGDAPLIANRDVIGKWETFTLVPQSDGLFALRAAANGRYVTAEQAGAQSLIANRTVVGPWEKFRVSTA